jgi:peptidoglycan/xylan/chitin deacetylase (PgdA/CDA1 family)
MLRVLSKNVIACACTWSGVVRLFARTDPSVMPFIVGYHRVVENFEESCKRTIPSMLIGTATFEQHVDWLARRFQIVSLDEIGDHLRTGQRFSRPAAAITFDDGYADVYQYAFPILRRKGLPAAVFVVTSLIGTKQLQLCDRLYMVLKQRQLNGKNPEIFVMNALENIGLPVTRLPEWGTLGQDPLRILTLLLNRFRHDQIRSLVGTLELQQATNPGAADEMAPMTWDMLKEMSANGITIGSHTKSHALLTSERMATVEAEVIESKRVLEEQLHRPVQHFAYPDGRCNPTIVRAIKKAGYEFGYTICHWRDGQDPLFTIPRKMLWERAAVNALSRFSSPIMNCHVSGVFDHNGGCEHDHRVVRYE